MPYEDSDPPALDCLVMGHLWVAHTEGKFVASWCLWCGTGVSNEHELEES